MAKKEFPGIHFYDQDFVDVYDQTWAWMEDYVITPDEASGLLPRLFSNPESPLLHQTESCFSTFMMVYSNKKYASAPQLDTFYQKQEENGAIRSAYFVSDGKAYFTPENPDGLCIPLFAWAEHNLYHKVGNKKRVKEVMPFLEKHFEWLDANFKTDFGLYAVPIEATSCPASPRKKAKYFIDFNAAQAMNALYLSELGEILNDKEISFKYKRHYFALKTKINTLMWNEDVQLYVDLDAEGNQVAVKSIASFWTLLAEIPNDARIEKLLAHLTNPETFGTPNPFPSLAVNQEGFQELGHGPNGSVYPHLTFMIIKGLEKYGAFELARESAIRHLYYMLDTLHPEGNKRGNVWEAYKPLKEGAAEWPDQPDFPRAQLLQYVGLSTIALMIENVIGLYISLPKKTVDWKVPTIEAMGIENLSLKRNMVTILSNKTSRGWEIRLESEKLYYFTIDILSLKKRKTLPIPSGKCSMLIDKL